MPLNSRRPIPAMSAKRRAALADQGVTNPMSTLTRSREPKTPKMATPAPVKRQAYTGPKRSVCALVDARSGGMCEFPGCVSPQEARHHRLNRKMGSRHGEARERLNGAAWLLAICTIHHEIITNPTGDLRETVERMGWVLREHQDATQTEVFTRHQVDPVFLTTDGRWVGYEDAAA